MTDWDAGHATSLICVHAGTTKISLVCSVCSFFFFFLNKRVKSMFSDVMKIFLIQISLRCSTRLLIFVEIIWKMI